MSLKLVPNLLFPIGTVVFITHSEANIIYSRTDYVFLTSALGVLRQLVRRQGFGISSYKHWT